MRVDIDLLSGKLISQSTCNDSLPDYMRVPKKIRILAGGRFLIEAGAAVQIFSADLARTQGMIVRKYVRAEAGSSLRIEADSSVTVIGA